LESLFEPQFFSDQSLAPTHHRRENFLVFGAPAIAQAEIQEVVACLESGWLGTGPKVAQFERDFAAYKQVQQAVAVNAFRGSESSTQTLLHPSGLVGVEFL
jgi:hypothetical protein